MRLIFFLGLMLIAMNASATEFFVSPHGNDSRTGTFDHPFATLTRARDAARQIPRGSGPIFITLRGGRYAVNAPLVLEPEDSGTAHAPLVIRAYESEKPIISGGRAVTGWKRQHVGTRDLWTAVIDEPLPTQIRQIWVNGMLRHAARHPNSGYLPVAGLPDTMKEWDQGQTRFNYREGDLPTTELGPDARVTTMTRWVESHLPIESIDPQKHLFNFKAHNVFRLDVNDPYYIEDSLALLDAPGEWYLDRKTRTLYYMPMPGEDMRKAEVIVPAIQQVLILHGNPEKDQTIHHVEIRGITFSHTSWDFTFPESTTQPQKVHSGFSQASIPVPSAVLGDGVCDCAFVDCTFEHIGNWALELARGCQRNRVEGCMFEDLGAGAIKIGEGQIREKTPDQSFANRVTNCTIHDGGNYFHSAVGIWIGQSFNNTIARNEISDFFYSGISLGWSWGYGQSLNRGNVVEENHVHHIGIRSDEKEPILSDMGGIYILGGREGTLVRRNVFHDIAGIHYGGWGIYLDEGSSNVVVEQNLVYRTTHGGFHLHYGKNNMVRNNIFAFARDHQIQHSKPEDHIGFTFTRNIVIADMPVMLAGPDNSPGATNDNYDHNLYWCTSGKPLIFAGKTWQQWHAMGKDEGSMIADPKFIDAQKNDFRLRDDSPALKIGFVPWLK